MGERIQNSIKNYNIQTSSYYKSEQINSKKEEVDIPSTLTRVFDDIGVKLSRIGEAAGAPNYKLTLFRKVMVLQHFARIVNALAKDANTTSGLFASSASTNSKTTAQVFEECDREAQILLGKNFNYDRFFQFINTENNSIGLEQFHIFNLLVSHRELRGFRATFGLNTASHNIILDAIDKEICNCYTQLAKKENSNEDCEREKTDLATWENATDSHANKITREDKLYAEVIMLELFKFPANSAIAYIKNMIFNSKSVHTFDYGGKLKHIQGHRIINAISNLTEKQYSALFTLSHESQRNNYLREVGKKIWEYDTSSTSSGLISSANTNGADDISQTSEPEEPGLVVCSLRRGDNMQPRVGQQLFGRTRGEENQQLNSSEPYHASTWLKRQGIKLSVSDKVKPTSVTSKKTKESFGDDIFNIVSEKKEELHDQTISIRSTRAYYAKNGLEDSFLDVDSERLSFSQVIVIKNGEEVFNKQDLGTDSSEPSSQLTTQYINYILGLKHSKVLTTTVEEYFILTAILDQVLQGIIWEYFSELNSTLLISCNKVTIDLDFKKIIIGARLTYKDNNKYEEKFQDISFDLRFAYKPLPTVNAVKGDQIIQDDSVLELARFTVDELFEFKISEVTIVDRFVIDTLSDLITGKRWLVDNSKQIVKIFNLLKFEDIIRIVKLVNEELPEHKESIKNILIKLLKYKNTYLKTAEYLMKLAWFSYLIDVTDFSNIVNLSDKEQCRLAIEALVRGNDKFVVSNFDSVNNLSNVFLDIFTLYGRNCSGIFLKELYNKSFSSEVNIYNQIQVLLNLVEQPHLEVEGINVDEMVDLLRYCLREGFSIVFCLELAYKILRSGIVDENIVVWAFGDFFWLTFKMEDVQPVIDGIENITDWEQNIISLRNYESLYTNVGPEKPPFLGIQDFVVNPARNREIYENDRKKQLDPRLFTDGGIEFDNYLSSIEGLSEERKTYYKELWKNKVKYYCENRLTSPEGIKEETHINNNDDETIIIQLRDIWNKAYNKIEKLLEFINYDGTNTDVKVRNRKLLFLCVREIVHRMQDVTSELQDKETHITLVEFMGSNQQYQKLYRKIRATISGLRDYLASDSEQAKTKLDYIISLVAQNLKMDLEDWESVRDLILDLPIVLQ